MPNLRTLEAGFSSSVTRLSQPEWDALAGGFADLTVYQTWAYGAVRWGEENLAHFVLQRSGQTVAAAQARVFRAPFLGLGVAYVRYGPLFRRCWVDERLNVFRQAVRALRNEFVCERGLNLRLNLNLAAVDEPDHYLAVLEEEGYHRARFVPPLRTLLLDLSPPLEELRSNLLQRWRNQLNQAEKRFGVEVSSGTGAQLFAEFARVYREMLRSKRFAVFTEVDEFAAIQETLPPEQKQLIVLGRAEGQTVAGTVLSVTGDKAIMLLAASNQQGRAVRASYAVQWHALALLKERGCHWYDLGGIDPVTNPGGYHFKLGLAGKDGVDASYVGQYECSPDVVRAAALRSFQALVTGYRRARLMLSGIRSRRGLSREAHAAEERRADSPEKKETSEVEAKA
ncbi:MAG: peptidoglycan bridge formation glycyltransferase FemA/FemB family protein [Calditrichaeota bacterium]|nr:peptidoglycan bridge formation glycyltransferase FemA/FemB family protein [Calditrichota bacterium]